MRSRYKLKEEEEERSGRERNCVYSTRKRDKHKHTHGCTFHVEKRVEALYESTQLSQQEFYIYFELQKVFK